MSTLEHVICCIGIAGGLLVSFYVGGALVGLFFYFYNGEHTKE